MYSQKDRNNVFSDEPVLGLIGEWASIIINELIKDHNTSLMKNVGYS